MADNRMWLKCRECGDKVLLGKCFSGRYGMFHTEKEIDEFFNKHIGCEPWENQFELEYETIREME